MAETKEIVRIANKDVSGHRKVKHAFREIKGIGSSLADTIAHIVSEEMGIDKESKIGDLTDDQIKKAEEVIDNPTEFGVPEFMLNRRKDRETGEDKHLTEADLDLQSKRDIDFMKSIRSYRGVRHMYGQRVRGQRTRTTGRSGMTLGVSKKKQKPGKEE